MHGEGAPCMRVKIRLVELNYIPLTDLRKKSLAKELADAKGLNGFAMRVHSSRFLCDQWRGVQSVSYFNKLRCIATLPNNRPIPL